MTYLMNYEAIFMNEDESKQLFIEQMQDFDKTVTEQILDILNEKQYILNVEVYGLASIIRALVNTYGNDEMIDGVVEFLQYK